MTVIGVVAPWPSDTVMTKLSIFAAADAPGAAWTASLLELKPVVDQLDGYFNGTATRFDLPLDPIGSDFQLAVWRELSRIPYASTTTYGQIAKAIGQPKAARAVGLTQRCITELLRTLSSGCT